MRSPSVAMVNYGNFGLQAPRKTAELVASEPVRIALGEPNAGAADLRIARLAKFQD